MEGGSSDVTSRHGGAVLSFEGGDGMGGDVGFGGCDDDDGSWDVGGIASPPPSDDGGGGGGGGGGDDDDGLGGMGDRRFSSIADNVAERVLAAADDDVAVDLGAGGGGGVGLPGNSGSNAMDLLGSISPPLRAAGPSTALAPVAGVPMGDVAAAGNAAAAATTMNGPTAMAMVGLTSFPPQAPAMNSPLSAASVTAPQSVGSGSGSDDDIEFVGMSQGSAVPAPPPPPPPPSSLATTTAVRPPSLAASHGVAASAASPAAQASYRDRSANMPGWMAQNGGGTSRERIIFPGGMGGQRQQQWQQQQPLGPGGTTSTVPAQFDYSQATYVEPVSTGGGGGPSTFTWADMVPSSLASQPESKKEESTKLPRAYKLSLLSVDEFTVTAVPTRHDYYYAGMAGAKKPSLAGLRIHIKKISRQHGGSATFEKDTEGSEGTGRWRIPLAAYQAFFAYLCSDPKNEVEGIPEYQLKIATLGRERRERGYPTPEDLMGVGVPEGLAEALAPYQRGGVDFVLDREGRALIADEMGLGKTVQGIAAMSAYHEEWPLLVLSPSTARYHWEAEFRQWLGAESMVNQPKKGGKDGDEIGKLKFDDEDGCDGDCLPERKRPRRGGYRSMPLLRKSHIHVLTSSKDPIFPYTNTRVVVCSYGLAPNLISSGVLKPSMFRCIIVDESHMLKNKKSKRTKTILPILKAARRVVMLSGTPALAKAMELWPQLSVLGVTKGWWTDEGEFVRKYAKSSSSANSPTDAPATEEEREGSNSLAELHTLLTSTVMIRRMKADILKSLPKKIRSSATVRITDRELRKEFREYMAMLREGEGVLGKLARVHHEEREKAREAGEEGHDSENEDRHNGGGSSGGMGGTGGGGVGGMGALPRSSRTPAQSLNQAPFGNPDGTCTLAQVHARINAECQERYDVGMDLIRNKFRNATAADPATQTQLAEMTRTVGDKCDTLRRRRMNELRNGGGWFDGKRISDWTGTRSEIPVASMVDRRIAQMTAKSTAATSSAMATPGEQDGEYSRKAILSHLYSLTGKSKIPLVVRMLKRWLADPARGKLCVFAHHIYVLDAIAQGAGLSNHPGSRTRYMRIDGSTLPKARQEAVSSFQTDPGVRVALLGITAAGVAVTLTAASDVWFTELFWTPAIMIQAEDRCHRIGQQASVKCLYLIGRGTLDEVLWKLIEKKFRDLGEFVEGKEKLDIVMHKQYACGMDALRDEGSELDDDEPDETDASGFESAASRAGRAERELEDLANAGNLQHDIEELAMEEQAMLKPMSGEEGEEDDADATTNGGESDIRAVKPPPIETGSSVSVGNSAAATASSSAKPVTEAVICLTDDDDDDNDVHPSSSSSLQQKENQPQHQPKPGTKRLTDVISENMNHKDTGQPITFSKRTSLPKLRFYRLFFPGPSYGLIMAPFEGRPVITRKHPSRVSEFGADVKPNVGDILLSLNGVPIPRGTEFTEVLKAMKLAITNSTYPVEILFGEEPEFKAFYKNVVIPREEQRARTKNQRGRAHAMAAAQQQGVGAAMASGVKEEQGNQAPIRKGVGHGKGINGSSNVIELLDED